MILSQVRDYLKQRGQCTLSDIALHFDIVKGAIKPNTTRLECQICRIREMQYAPGNGGTVQVQGTETIKIQGRGGIIQIAKQVCCCRPDIDQVQ